MCDRIRIYAPRLDNLVLRFIIFLLWLQKKALIFHWRTHWCTFLCWYVQVSPFFPPHPSRAFLRHLAPFQHTHRGRMCQKARLLNLCAPTEQTTTRGKIDSLWQCCWNHCGQTDCRVTVASPLLSSPQTEHRLKATIWQLDMPRQHCTLKNSRLPQSSPQHGASSAVTLLSWWFKSHLTDTDAFPYPFLCVFVLLQKASATWQWTPTRLQCRCQTPTPGRQLWITWGCLQWEWLDSHSCQVPDFSI